MRRMGSAPGSAPAVRGTNEATTAAIVIAEARKNSRRAVSGQLSRAAIDEDEVRKRPALFEQLSVAPQHDFVHGREIVRDGPSELGPCVYDI